MSDTPKRGGWSFTIRELFLLTVVAALVLGWFLDRERLKVEIRRLESYEESRQKWLSAIIEQEVKKELEFRKRVEELGGRKPFPSPKD